MKKYISLVILIGFLYSCEEYLERVPEADLQAEDIFKDFAGTQGFLEDMYGYVTNYAVHPYHSAAFLLGDEVKVYGRDFVFQNRVEEGVLRRWYKGSLNRRYNYFDLNRASGGQEVPNPVHNQTRQYGAGIWQGWAGIRRANTVLENIDLMVNATEFEKDLIRGQALFFRAFFHHEIMKFWGRIPYIESTWDGDANYTQYQRPATFADTAIRLNEDLEEAAKYLPESWSDLAAQIANDPSLIRTLRVSELADTYMHINKAIVYAYQGKNWLLAASPLMQGTTDTYGYSQEFCDNAAAAFAKVIDLDNRNVNNLGLASKEDYYKVFYSTQEDGNSIVPGTRPEAYEFIFSAQPSHSQRRQLPATFALQENGACFQTPTHSFVQHAFGMKDGMSIEDSPLYDPTDPWANRDPRFDMWIIKDGDQITVKPSNNAWLQYAELYTGGTHRDFFGSNNNGGKSGTGYAAKKWYPIDFNRHDNRRNIITHHLLMRLTDVYLMYAEAMAMSSYGPSGNPAFVTDGGVVSMSGLEAINLIRARYPELPSVDTSYPGIGGNPQKFMDVLRKERAMELSFEAHRWVDIRRWVLADKLEYREKTALDFIRDANGKPIEMSERTLVTTVCEYPKHFWLPFPLEDVQIFEGFEQNPGW